MGHAQPRKFSADRPLSESCLNRLVTPPKVIGRHPRQLDLPRVLFGLRVAIFHR
jgi:hypothetical protein